MLRSLAGLVVQTLLFAALVLAPAWAVSGSLIWPRGLAVLAGLVAVSTIGTIWLAIIDPALARERASLPKLQSTGDAIASAAIAGAVIGWFCFAAYDALRMRLIEPAPTLSLAVGAAAFAAGTGLILWTLKTNSFAVAVVRVQDDRGQQVIDTGPYAIVRHPMYLGAVLFFAGLGLLLGSAAASLLAVPLFVLAFTPRMIVEERALCRDLDGYTDYRRRVKARILPAVF